MNSNMTKYLALEKKFNEYGGKFRWWNGIEFGTILGMVAGLMGKSTTAWAVCAIAFIFEAVIAFIYLKKINKTLEEMRKL